jgi:hypothetical protein
MKSGGEPAVSETGKAILTVTIIAGLFAAGRIAGPVAAQGAVRTEKLKAVEIEVRRLWAQMDRDRKGKVSKQEFMSFMEAEFDRLDRNRGGKSGR